MRNIDFDDDDGKILWDQALNVRDLPISTPEFWTAMVVSAWQAEEPEDADPDTEDQVGVGVTKGLATHKEFLGDTETLSSLGASYTGMVTVLKAIFGESAFSDFEQYTIVHEVGHTFGLDHSDGGAMCIRGDCQREPFSDVSIRKLREYVSP